VVDDLIRAPHISREGEIGNPARPGGRPAIHEQSVPVIGSLSSMAFSRGEATCGASVSM
jgi:hypothetical protein